MSALTTLLAAVAGFLAVALGAFGAHALAPHFDARAERLWALASQYLLLHAAALLGLGARLAGRAEPAEARLLVWAVVSFAIGLATFTGSLYALALGAPKQLGAITPLGGLLLLVGWLLLGVDAWRSWP